MDGFDPGSCPDKVQAQRIHVLVPLLRIHPQCLAHNRGQVPSHFMTRAQERRRLAVGGTQRHTAGNADFPAINS